MQAKASEESASSPVRPCGLCGKPVTDKETEDYISSGQLKHVDKSSTSALLQRSPPWKQQREAGRTDGSVCSQCGPQDCHLACVQDYLIGRSQEFTNSIRRQKVKEKSLRRPQEEFASWKCPDGIYLGQWVGRGTDKHWEGPICPGSIQSAEWIKPRKEKKTSAPAPAKSKVAGAGAGAGGKAGAAAGGKKVGATAEDLARTDFCPPGLTRPRSYGGGGGGAGSGGGLSSKQDAGGAGAGALQKNKSWGPGSGGLWFEKGTRPRHLKMCIHWSEYGECRMYGCEFCHGEEELAQREQEWREEQAQRKREKELEEQERKRVALEDHIYNTQALIPLTEETFELMKEFKMSRCVASLVEMGFTTRQANLASQATGAAVAAAVQLLTSGETIATLSNKPSKPVDVSRESEQILEKASLLGFTAAAVEGQIKACSGDWNAAEEAFEELARVQAMRRAEQEAEEAAAHATASVQQAQQEAGQDATPSTEEGWHFGGGEGQLPSWPEEAVLQNKPPGEHYTSTAFQRTSTTQGLGGLGSSQQVVTAVAQQQQQQLQQQPVPAPAPSTFGSMHTAHELLRTLLPATPPPSAQARGASISPPDDSTVQGEGSQVHAWTVLQPPMPPNSYRQSASPAPSALPPFGPPPPLAPAAPRSQAPQQQASLATPQLPPAGHPPQPAAAPGPAASLFNSPQGHFPPGPVAGAPAAAMPSAYDSQGAWPLGGFSSGGISPRRFTTAQQQQQQQPQHYPGPHVAGHATEQQQQQAQLAQHYGGHQAQQHHAGLHAAGHATGQQQQQQAQLAQQHGGSLASGPAPSFSFLSQGPTASAPPASLGLPGPVVGQPYVAGGGGGEPTGSFDSGFQAGLAAAMAHLGLLNTGTPGVGAVVPAQPPLASPSPPLAGYHGVASAAPTGELSSGWHGQALAPAAVAHAPQASASPLGLCSVPAGAGGQAGHHPQYTAAHGAGRWASAGMGDAMHVGLGQQTVQQAQQGHQAQQNDFEDMLQLLCST